MVQVTSPHKTITLGVSNVNCYWFSVFNPIVFKAQRRDVSVLAIYPIDAVSFFIEVPPSIDSSQVGNYLYFNSGLYNGTYEILSVTTGVSTQFIQVAGQYLGTTSNGFVNFYSDNYYVEFVLSTVVDGVTYTDTINLTPSAIGQFNLEVQDVVAKYLGDANTRTYGSGVNNADKPHTGYFTLKYRTIITYGGNTTTSNYSLVSGGNPYYFTKSALQFGAEYDSNLANYVPLWGNATVGSTEPDVSNNAKFLTKFAKPVYHEGWPFDLSFIYSEALHGQQVQKVEQFFDLNGSPVGAGSSFADLNSAGLEYVNQINLIGTYATAVKELNVYLRINNSGDDALIAPQTFTSTVRPLITTSGGNQVLPLTSPFATGYATGYYNEYISGATPDLRITEQLPIEVVQCYKIAPFYVCWLNKLGGYDYYMFEGDQEYNIQTESIGTYQKYYTDLSTTERATFDTGFEREDSYTLIAESIPKDHVNALRDVLTSTEVYKIDKDGTKTRLRVESGGFTPYGTEQPTGTFEIVVTMPDVL